jgi:hypothetical protein
MRAVRGLLVLLALISVAVGAFAFLTPHAFYLHVLGVDRLGPYDQHLVSDVGGFYLGFALVLAWAARSLDQALVRAVRAGFLLTQALHLGYHLVHLDRFTLLMGAEQTVQLAALVVIPAAVLGLSADHTRSYSRR